MRTLKTYRALLLAGALLLPASATLQAASEQDPDWPCVQRQMPSLTAGMMWAGPPLDQLPEGLRNDPELERLATRAAARSLEMEQISQEIAAFAEAQPEAERNDKLTALFAEVLERINVERDAVMDGIKRYARRQAKLAQKIELLTVTIDDIPASAEEEDLAYKAQLEEQRIWDTRIFDEREDSLTAVCETPVLLEQRAFALAREIMNHMVRD